MKHGSLYHLPLPVKDRHLPERYRGRQIGKYRITRLIGGGTFSWVYEAIDQDLEIPVALKILRPEFSGQDVAEARFRREAATAARLRHRNIVTVRDVGPVDGVVFVPTVRAFTATATAGLVAGDRITAINDQPVESWNQLRWELLQSDTERRTVELTVDHLGSSLTRQIDLPRVQDPSKEDPLRAAGLTLGASTPKIRSVVADSVGAKAGLLAGDIITRIANISNPDISISISTIQQHPEQVLSLQIDREGKLIDLTITPAAFKLESGQTVGRVGVQLGGDVPMVNVSFGLWESILRGFTRTAETAWFSLKMMGKMVTGVQSMELVKRVTKKPEGEVYISGVPMVDQGPKGYCAVASFCSSVRMTTWVSKAPPW